MNKKTSIRMSGYKILALVYFLILCSGLGGVCSKLNDLEYGDLPLPEHLGVYFLESIDGNPIPFSPMHQGAKVPPVVEGTVTLKGDGSFESTITFEKEPGHPSQRHFKGTCKRKDSEYMFYWEGAGKTKVVITDNTLTLNNEGTLFTYKKRDTSPLSLP